MSTGIPSTLIVKTDSTDSLSVSMSAPTPPYISSVFSNTVIKTDANGNLLVAASGGGGAPDDATYITQTPNATLTNEQALSLLSSGIMRVATTTGVVTALTDSAGIAANISDETGSGFLVFGTLPAITFPNTGVVIRDVGNDHTLTIAPGTDLSANRILTLTTGDAARTITLTGNPTLNDWFDQSVKVASNPTFGNITGGTYNSQTISSAANFTGTLAVAGLTTLSATGDHWNKGSLSLGPAQSASIGAGDLSVARSATTAYLNFGSNGTVNLALASSVLTLNGATLTVSGFGTNRFSAGGTGANQLSVRNTTAGTGNHATFAVGNDGDANAINLFAFSTTYTTSGPYIANAGVLDAQVAGGLSIAATNASGAIRFYSGGITLRWTIDSAGNLFTGTVATGTNHFYVSGSDASVQTGKAGTASAQHIGFVNNNGEVGTIKTSGSATAYNTSSDQRLKRDVAVATTTDILRRTVIHDFDWIADGTRARGVFAQEAYAVAPFAVSVGSDEMKDGHLAKPWSVDYSKFVPDLIVGWQQHDARLAVLEAKLLAAGV